jgi:hypothetical protein
MKNRGLILGAIAGDALNLGNKNMEYIIACTRSTKSCISFWTVGPKVLSPALLLN